MTDENLDYAEKLMAAPPIMPAEKMTVTEVRECKKKLEKELSELIAEKINAFEIEVGTSSTRFEFDVFHHGKDKPTTVSAHCYVYI